MLFQDWKLIFKKMALQHRLSTFHFKSIELFETLNFVI